MRKSRSITLTVLAGLMLTACCSGLPGCSRHNKPEQHEPDHTWYDERGNAIPEKWQTDLNGNKAVDAEGRPIPQPHVPYDRYRRLWVFANGVWAPLPPLQGATSSSSSSSTSSSSSSTSRLHPIIWGGSGYRTFGPSSPPARPSSSINRGGFGSTGLGSGS